MAFNAKLSWEFLSGEEIEARSVKAVRNHVKHLREVSPYYREVLASVDPSEITSFETIAQLPLTDKTTLSDNCEQFRAVGDTEIVETIMTSGATGHPLIYPMTRSDLDRLAFNEALSANAAGLTPKDRAQILVSLDSPSIGGMATYRGLTTLGVNTARIGVLRFDMQKYYFDLLSPTVLVGAPSYLRKFGEQLVDAGVNPGESPVTKIVCIDESVRNEYLELNSAGKNLQELFGANVYSSYGIAELFVAYTECAEQNGNHAHPELVYTEIVDTNGNPVEDGMPGELVGTPLGVEGLPLLRYRTGNMTFKIQGTCPCGRNSDRIGPIQGGDSQVIKLKDTIIYPLVMTNALDELDYIEDYVLLLEGNESFSDHLTLHVATQPAMLENIVSHLRAKADVTVPVLISNVPTINSYRADNSQNMKIVDKRQKQ